ncbi:hypothetical protein RF11_05790 [Thelohanellus kitauei]|uniref:Uncharacterized protein n=1 Tax=Thelohanellus kitauei TaxID=669202 RepID=A0A0C2I7B5_THEKT|nr:hypothetical protein RF11_05790 [Thelohanellus kitauei]
MANFFIDGTFRLVPDEFKQYIIMVYGPVGYNIKCGRALLTGKGEKVADGATQTRLNVCVTDDNPNIVEVEATYSVSFRIDRVMRPHTMADELLLQAAKDIIRVMIVEEYIWYTGKNLTSADINVHMKEEIKSSILPILSIKLDESTDVANGTQLLVYARYIHYSVLKINYSSVNEGTGEYFRQQDVNANPRLPELTGFLKRYINFNQQMCFARIKRYHGSVENLLKLDEKREYAVENELGVPQYCCLKNCKKMI